MMKRDTIAQVKYTPQVKKNKGHLLHFFKWLFNLVEKERKEEK